MTNNYQWAVNTMTAYPEMDGKIDVVFQAAWVCSATDGVNNTATYGTVDLTLDPSAPFTPYADLTLDQVLDWVFALIVSLIVNKNLSSRVMLSMFGCKVLCFNYVHIIDRNF